MRNKIIDIYHVVNVNNGPNYFGQIMKTTKRSQRN